MYVYLITNLVNQKVYIGQHIDRNPKYFGSGKILLRAKLKYGIENFKIERLVDNITDKNCLDNIEIYLIDWYRKHLGRDNVYNIANGGHSGSFKNSDLPDNGLERSFNCSQAQLKHHAENPGYRKQMFENNPEIGEQISKSLKLTYSDNPDIIRNMRIKLLEFYVENPGIKQQMFDDKPEIGEQISKSMIKLYEDPEYYEKHRAGQCTPEAIENKKLARIKYYTSQVSYYGTIYLNIRDLSNNTDLTFRLIQKLIKDRNNINVFMIKEN